MKFTIQINEGPYQHQASDTAFHFVKASLDKGHEVVRVFFYHDGVNNGTSFATPPQGDRNVQERWSKLAQEYGLDLVLCVAACKRRGIVDGNFELNNKNNLAEGFRVSGLGQLIDASIKSDRLIVFGD